ncbi:hypothetical protein EBQ34_00395 [Vandammella animalimorsus]|uniref:Uncharacterized protein n=1 Tax=Vandammella animalimorsus TaxID=2029117 RepID=A0A3M6RU62_9BURK|nr:hypothetical protein [Vandammella animalimorsus]RMX18856.1 hypothetical protein EBQ34_00395 [Vandammella animalimorsus]
MSIAATSIIWNGQGPVMIGTFDPTRGRPENGFLVDIYSVGCGNRTLTATPSRETTTLKESCSGQRLTLKELETSKSLQVSLSMVQFDARTLAQAFYGEAVVKQAGTVTDEVLAELKPGDYFFLKYPRSKSVVIEDSTGSPKTYVEGTHYKISDAAHSRYQLIAHPGGHTEPLKVDYSYDGYVNIAAFSKTNVEKGLIFSGINGDGQKVRVIIPRISLAMSGDFGWISDEPSELTLGGQALYVPELQSDADFGPFMRVDVMPDL